MRFRLMTAMATVALAAFVAAGCGDDGGGGGGGDGDFDGNVAIGALVPLSGQLKDFGGPGSQAANLAITQINAAAGEAGLDGEATLAEEDSQTTEQGGIAAAEKLVSEGVSCIAGDWPSSSTIAVSESVTVDEGIPLISPSSTDPTITDLEDEGLVFRTAPSDALQGQVMAEAIAADNPDAVISVAGRNDAYGSSLVETFSESATAAGLTVGDPVLYNPDQASFDADAARIATGTQGADTFVIVDYPDVWVKLGPALARTGDWSPEATWVPDGLKSGDLPANAGAEVTNGMRGTAPTSLEFPAGEAFDGLWTEEVGEPRQTYDAQNFDAVMACYLGAVAAGSDDGEEIADALAEVTSPPGTEVTFENLAEGIELLLDGEDINYEGASGPIDWDDNGDPSASNYEIWQYQNGAITTLDVVSFGAEGGDDEGGTETAPAGDDTAMEGETSMEGDDTAMEEETPAEG